MKRCCLFAVIAFCVFWHRPARAEVSEDLKFCSALKSSKERLACYDAAMRLGKNVPVVLAPVAVAPPPISHLPPEPKKSRFAGLYAGVTGGYEFANSKPYNDSPFLSSFSYPVVPIDSRKGGKLGGVLGYNAQAESLLLGFETRAQYSFSRSTQSSTIKSDSGITFPYTTASMTCYGCTQDFLNSYPTNVGPLTLNSSTFQEVARYHQWQVDFSARSGMIFGDWLFYAKAGLGAEDSLYKASATNTNAVCDPIVVRQRPDYNSVAIAVTGCNSITNVTTTSSSALRTVTPITILGGGLERNFENFFLRAEGELTAHFIEGGGIYYSPSANVAGGYRF